MRSRTKARWPPWSRPRSGWPSSPGTGSPPVRRTPDGPGAPRRTPPPRRGARSRGWRPNSSSRPRSRPIGATPLAPRWSGSTCSSPGLVTAGPTRSGPGAPLRGGGDLARPASGGPAPAGRRSTGGHGQPGVDAAAVERGPRRHHRGPPLGAGPDAPARLGRPLPVDAVAGHAALLRPPGAGRARGPRRGGARDRDPLGDPALLWWASQTAWKALWTPKHARATLRAGPTGSRRGAGRERSRLRGGGPRHPGRFRAGDGRSTDLRGRRAADRAAGPPAPQHLRPDGPAVGTAEPGFHARRPRGGLPAERGPLRAATPPQPGHGGPARRRHPRHREHVDRPHR